MAIIAPSQYTMISGAGTSTQYPALVYTDANGSIATVTNPWYLNASGILVPAPVDTNGVPQMSMTGSSATVDSVVVGDPSVVATNFIPTTAGVASAIIKSGLFTRNAKRRCLIFFNNGSESATVSVYLWDNINPTTLGTPASASVVIPSKSSYNMGPSEYPAISDPVNSCVILVTQTTLSVTDGMDVWKTEIV